MALLKHVLNNTLLPGPRAGSCKYRTKISSVNRHLRACSMGGPPPVIRAERKEVWESTDGAEPVGKVHKDIGGFRWHVSAMALVAVLGRVICESCSKP